MDMCTILSGAKEKEICGNAQERTPQKDNRIQSGDEAFCRSCGRAVSIKWSYCPDCGNCIIKTPEL